jgi:hypothetical protein
MHALLPAWQVLPQRDLLVDLPAGHRTVEYLNPIQRPMLNMQNESLWFPRSWLVAR